MTSEFTFTEECEVCGAKPVYKDLGMCAVCTHGTASALWDWLDDDWKGKERKLAEKYVMETFAEIELLNKDGSVDPLKAALLHIDQHVLDRVEALL